MEVVEKLGTWEHSPPAPPKKSLSMTARHNIALLICVVVLVVVVWDKFYAPDFKLPSVTIDGLRIPGLSVTVDDQGATPVVAAIPTEAFPDIDTTGLSSLQIRIIELLRQEYAAQRPGTFYSEGVQEPWCADFISWIMREAGAPLSNPNSGYWRIPGVYTLEEYYSNEGRFSPRPEGYVPQVGDVIMYDDSSNFGQHASFVIISDGERVVTVGANKRGRDPKGYVTIDTINRYADPGIVGYGLLPGSYAA